VAPFLLLWADLWSTTQPALFVAGQTLTSSKADIFISYCWNNSLDAKERNQIGNVVGGKFSDPRLIQKKLLSVVGLSAWIDIERLESASEGMGMVNKMLCDKQIV